MEERNETESKLGSMLFFFCSDGEVRARPAAGDGAAAVATRALPLHAAARHQQRRPLRRAAAPRGPRHRPRRPQISRSVNPHSQRKRNSSYN